jgi:hypothetical protein
MGSGGSLPRTRPRGCTTVGRICGVCACSRDGSENGMAAFCLSIFTRDALKISASLRDLLCGELGQRGSSSCRVDTSSQVRLVSNPLHVLEQNLLSTTIIKLCGPAIGVASNPLSRLESAVILEKIRDTGCSK